MQRRCDFLVVGSGVAGLFFALRAARMGTVLLVTKRSAEDSNTMYAQGGIAAVWDPTDSPEEHIDDTIVAGAGLCRREIVEIVVREGPQRVAELIEFGVEFSRSAEDDSKYDLGQEGGHSHRRILHAKDMTGQEIVRALLQAVRENPAIEILEQAIVVDLLTGSWLARRSGAMPPVPDTVHGAYVLNLEEDRVETIQARQVALCTGGAGKVYLFTSNPDLASGDGVAMAYRAGARVRNMEFVQFHPTCLYHPDAGSFLISEACRGEGGILRDSNGRAFMRSYDERAELAPRDIVARAIDGELKKRGDDCVFLDMTHHERSFLEGRFPAIFKRCLQLGIDISKEAIPVVPAAHYFCGGVATDAVGRSSIEGLYVVGESACTGLHGANRLASNSLLEAVVFAHRAVEAAASRLAETPWVDLPEWEHGGAVDLDELVVINQTWEEIRRFMWNYVGIVRTTRRLQRAQHRVQLVQEEIRNYYWDFRLTGDLLELRNLATVAGLVVDSALLRRESRGLHYNLDFPSKDSRFVRDTEIWRRL
ncbi:MAG: L-aspartate oxidase [Myxococcota bacterium]|nr:L-aspartate oxidase [Myxococcota bacterium]